MKTVFSFIPLAFGYLLLASLNAQEPVSLVERQTIGSQYHVSCRVDISGALPLPEEKGKGSKKMLKVVGKSSIEYDEKLLQENSQKQIDRTIRWYDKLDFERTVGDDMQQNSLRPEVRRLVILRTKQYEVPFAPAGPLMWGEIELVRTDVFTPALKGLLPKQAVKPGERWQADQEAIQELTDLEKITEGKINCALESITTLVGRRQARVSFEGEVQGISEDGNARHKIDGSLYFDLDAQLMSYLSVKGTHFLLDPKGQTLGQIEGSFTLTREPRPRSNSLSAESLRGLTLEPNDDNTQLLFEDAKIGLRFRYPRSWHLAGADQKGKKIGVDHNRGSGLLVVAEPAGANANLLKHFQQGVLQGLKEQNANVLVVSKTDTIQPGVVTFRIEAMAGKEKIQLRYYVVEQRTGSATVTALLKGPDSALVEREAERIVRSLEIMSSK